MLQSYLAELHGNQLHWLGATRPQLLPHQRVLVVVESASLAPSLPLTDAPPTTRETEPRYALGDLAGRLQWKGDAVLAQRQQRDAW